MALGIGLARLLDPLVDGRKAARIRELTLPIYQDMARDPAFADMVMDGEDHFLLFSQRQAVLDRLGAWIEECEQERSRE